MSRRTRAREKGRTDGPITLIPHSILNCPAFISLSHTARALLLEFARQYNGHTNNGDLCVAHRLMGPRGWARNTLERARRELECKGFIVRTRQGGRNQPNLYAITWKPINDCGGKLDAGFRAGEVLGYWRLGHNPYVLAESDKQAA